MCGTLRRRNRKEEKRLGKVTPIKAIRAKCLECCAGQTTEVRLCTIKNCALYPYRMGRRPKDEECINERHLEEKTEDS